MKVLIIFVLLVCLSGCADAVSFRAAGNIQAVGFWHGLWHGWIAPLAWLASLLNDSIAVYAIYNNGGWYDFGFLLGIGALSSSGVTVKKR